MGLFINEVKRNARKQKEAALAERRGKELGKALLDYNGGYGPEYKKTQTGDWLRCYEHEVYYKKRDIVIPTDQIASFEVTGLQQTNSRISVTRMATLGIFSLAAPKRSAVKDASVHITLKDGRQLFFHTTVATQATIHQKLADAISYYHSLQVQRGSQHQPQTTAQPTDNAEEIIKYADLRKRGVITEEEFLAKKKQLLGL